MWLLTMALACFLAGGGWLRAQAPASGNDYIQQFESSYHDVHSLAADFTQTYTLGETSRVETGHVIFARGGLMRWDYGGRNKKLFISDGKQMSLYVPADRQLTRAPVKSSQDFRAPFELLLSRFNLRRVFERVEIDDAALEHAAGDHVLRGFPKKQFAEAYRDVLIVLDPQLNLRRLVVDYPDQSRMDFRFDKIERNPPAPPALFQFTPPPGTEIIDQNQGK